MGRSGLVWFVLIIVSFLFALTGCGGSSSKPGTPVPTIITVSPSVGSLDIGETLSFTASALTAGKTAVNAPITFQSSNPAVLTMATLASSGGAAAGLACAGTWDAAAQVCTPGGSGTTQVTATSGGVTSAPVTVYVHQHIDKITVIPQGTPPSCLSAAPALGQSFAFQAVASSGNQDISATVGPFNWTAVTPAVVQLNAQSVNGVLNGQVTAVPKTPGVTQFFASIANTTSIPFNFTTCPVRQITLAVNGTGGTTITAAKGTSSTIAATAVDQTNNALPISQLSLTWTSSNPTVATVSSAGAVSSLLPGGTTITASCTPPTCNIGFVPAQPIYAAQPISATYSGTNTTAHSIYATSTGCSTTANCEAVLLPITGTPAALGNGVLLPSIPNSFLFNAQGTKAYLGSETGLMQFDPAATSNSVTVSPATTGKVLAVSPKGDKVIVSDTTGINKLFILDTANNTPISLLIKGANAAAFSPDGLKAFIVASNPTVGTPCTVAGSCTLYVYSPQAPLQTIDLTDPSLGPATDVAFLGSGDFGYLARGSGASFLATCDDPGDPAHPLPGQLTPVPVPASLLRPLPDGHSILALAPPSVSTITANIPPLPSPPVPPAVIGCPVPYTLSFPPPSDPFGTGFSGTGALTNTSNPSPAVDLGQGAFTPVAVLVSTEGQKAFILAHNVLNVIVYDISGHSTSSLPLVGNAAPIAGSLAPDGETLYVTTADNKLHVINLVAGGDLEQLALPSANLCVLSTGGSVSTCQPDLLAVRP
jgi:Big-like domain-containing protein